jgi:hypothetical protein
MNVNDLALQVSTIATASATHAWALIGNFLILLILTLVMIGFSYYGGRGGIISLIMSFYCGYAIYMVFPYTNTVVNAGGTALIKAILSVILYFLCSFIPYLFINRLIKGGFGILSFVPRFVLSFLAACFLLALAYHIFSIPDAHIYTFPEPINSLFGPNKYYFWWFLSPLAGLFFLVH